MRMRQFMAVLGAVTLLVGVSLPVLVVEAGFVRLSLTLFDMDGMLRVIAYLLLLFGIAIIITAFLGKDRFFLPLGFGALLGAVLGFFNLQAQLANAVDAGLAR
jgi:hypothetical protein